METKESKKYINQLKDSIHELSSNIDDLYSTLYQEARKDVLKEEERKEQISIKANNIYRTLTEEKCITLIKTTLPLRIRLINKIIYVNKFIDKNNTIRIYYALNTWDYQFIHDFYVEDIKRILKIN